MDKNAVFEVLQQQVLDILPELDPQKITLQASLKELGANSIDRAEIIMLTLASLKSRVAMSVFAQAKNIDELCQIIVEHSSD